MPNLSFEPEEVFELAEPPFFAQEIEVVDGEQQGCAAACIVVELVLVDAVPKVYVRKVAVGVFLFTSHVVAFYVFRKLQGTAFGQ